MRSVVRESPKDSASQRRPLVVVVYGTRPEAIKTAPLVLGLRDRGKVSVRVVTTGQHRSMLDEVNAVFGINPDIDLGLFEPGQGIEAIVAKTLLRLTPYLESERPDAVLVHGDTSTANGAAQSAFYLRIPIIHLEAGLRTYDLASPFPEEANRQLIGRLTRLHLAPTERNRRALLAEGVRPQYIAVTGNTVVDALRAALARCGIHAETRGNTRRILVTLHRRENLGPPMTGIARAIARVARESPDVQFQIPLHLNPAVRQAVLPEWEGLDGIHVVEPMEYISFAAEIAKSGLIVTDSGGLQEEGPGIGRPVLVTRNTTERPEAIDAGTVRLIGTAEADVYRHLRELLDDAVAYEKMAHAVNPYGDGHAVPRCAAAIEEMLGVGARLPDFVAARQQQG